MTHSDKKEYASPQLTKFGAVEEITQGNMARGQAVDADFVIGPPGNGADWS